MVTGLSNTHIAFMPNNVKANELGEPISSFCFRMMLFALICDSSEIWSDRMYDSWPRRWASSEIRSVVVNTANAFFLYRMTNSAVLSPEVAKHRETEL